MTPVDFQVYGILGMLFGGVFSLVFWLNSYDGEIISKGLAIVFTIIFITGIVFTIYSYPLVDADNKLKIKIEQQKESYIKQADCNTIQQYRLDTAQSDNETTKYAKKIFDIKCIGGLTT